MTNDRLRPCLSLVEGNLPRVRGWIIAKIEWRMRSALTKVGLSGCVRLRPHLHSIQARSDAISSEPIASATIDERLQPYGWRALAQG